MPNSMSEDELFKTLLKKKPEVQISVRKEAQRTAPVQAPVEENPVAVREILAAKALESEAVLESIKNLNASVNTLYGLVKTVIVPVLVLILIVGIAILVKSQL